MTNYSLKTDLRHVLLGFKGLTELIFCFGRELHIFNLNS